MMTDRKELLEVLKSVQPAVAAKDNNMQQNHIVFYDNMAMAYNDEVAIYHDLPESLVGIGTFAVPAKEIIALLEKLSVEEIDLTLTDNKLEIKGGRSKCHFTIQSEIKMPVDEICDWSTDNKKLPANFANALRQVNIATGRDMTKPLTTCVYFHENSLLATDNYQCSRYDFGKKFKWAESIYLPRNSAQIVGSFPSLEQYGITNGWIQFINTDNTMTITCRTYYKGQPFADTSELFEADGVELKIPSKLQPALERAGLFVSTNSATNEETYVKIDVSENKITVSGKSGIGGYSESMRIEYDSEPKGFYIRTDLLKRIMQEGLACKLCERFLRITDAKYDFITAYVNTD